MSVYLTKPANRTFVEKGWGFEDWIWNDENYCGKRLFFNKNKRCSFHYHAIKDEVLYLQSGLIVMRYSLHDDLDHAEFDVLVPGSAFHVPPGLRHQMIAVEESMIFEVSTHHEDSDSIRVIKGD